jgi:hypothetical protein
MRTKLATAAATVLCLAGSTSAQTPRVSYELSWKALPSNNQGPHPLLQFGDYAQIVLTARVSPPIGSVISLPNNTQGTVAGLGSISFDLKACDAIVNNNPQWTLSGQGFQGTTGTTWGLRSGWMFGFAGTPQPDGSVLSIQTAQFVPPGGTPSSTNPVSEIWRGKWNPGTIQPGNTTRFTCYPIQSTVYVQTGPDPTYASIAATADPSTIQILHDPGSPPPCFPGWYSAAPDQNVLPGEAAIFTAQVPPPFGGCSPWQYRWRRNCTWLDDGGNISGSHTATLRIDPATAADADFYVLMVSGTLMSNWQGSDASRLIVGCYPNCDKSTASPILNANDFQCFLNRFAAGDPYANCDGSTSPPVLNANDFQCYLNTYAAGCS